MSIVNVFGGFTRSPLISKIWDGGKCFWSVFGAEKALFALFEKYWCFWWKWLKWAAHLTEWTWRFKIVNTRAGRSCRLCRQEATTDNVDNGDFASSHVCLAVSLCRLGQQWGENQNNTQRPKYPNLLKNQREGCKISLSVCVLMWVFSHGRQNTWKYVKMREKTWKTVKIREKTSKYLKKHPCGALRRAKFT